METKSLALIVPSQTQLFSPYYFAYYFTEVLRGCMASASIFNYDILLQLPSLPVESRDYYKPIAQKKADGVIVVAPLFGNEGVRRLEEKAAPTVLINSVSSKLNYVDSDNKQGAFKAVEYLIGLGHKKIAVINGMLNGINGRDRFAGYKDCLAKNNIALNENLVGYGEYSQDKGYEGMKKMLKFSPSAVFCANDFMAIGAIKAIKEADLKIPEDISIVGFDDLTTSSHLNPPLTTVRQPFFDLGKEAINLLIDQIKSKKSPRKVILKTKLIVRKSCSPR